MVIDLLILHVLEVFLLGDVKRIEVMHGQVDVTGYTFK